MKSTLAILLLVIVIHFTSNTFGIYDMQIAAGNVWIDNLLHVLVGLAIALFWQSFTKGKCSISGTLAFVLTLAIGWEILELLFYALAPAQALGLKIYSPSIQEATVDIASNFLGAILLIAWRLAQNKGSNIVP